MTELELFLRDHGLWAVVLAAAVEGDLTLLLTGMMVHHGLWSAPAALLAGVSGAMVGDCFYFFLGHGAARHWFETKHARKVIFLENKSLQRHGWLSLFLSRYVYGARIATMVYWGSRRLSWSRFIPLDAASCLIWATVFGGVGYLFSSSIEALIGEIRRVESRLLIGLVIFAVLMIVRYFWVGRAPEAETGPSS